MCTNPSAPALETTARLDKIDSLASLGFVIDEEYTGETFQFANLTLPDQTETLVDEPDDKEEIDSAETNPNDTLKFESDALFQLTDHELKLISDATISNSNEDLKSSGVLEAISGETIKTAIVPEDASIIYPNFTLDFSNVAAVTQFQMRGIDSLLAEEGDTAVYVWAKPDIIKIGYGEASSINKSLPIAVKRIFNGECKLYRNIVPGTAPKETTGIDISTLRMQI